MYLPAFLLLGDPSRHKSDETVRWTITVPRQTDVSLRAYLAQAGLRKGNLSEFVADAVRWRLFNLDASAARAQNIDEPSEEIEDAIEAALVLTRLPYVDRSRDPGDNFLLAMAGASEADYLATGSLRDDLHGTHPLPDVQ